MFQSLKKIVRPYKDMVCSIRRQRKEINDYINHYVPVHKELFAPLFQFKDKHLGQRVFIVATGPSLTIEDVDKLNGEICFSMNSGFKLKDKTNFFPQYYVICDGNAYRKLKDEMKNYSLPPIFYNQKDIKWDLEGFCTYPLPISVSLVVNHWQRRHLPKFVLRKRMSHDITHCIYMGDTVVNVIIQLCFYMGFKEIYLLGTDCNYFGQIKHSSAVSYKGEDVLPNSPEDIYEGMIADYNRAKIEADKLGVKIYNATRGGMLEVFERVDLDEILGLK